MLQVVIYTTYYGIKKLLPMKKTISKLKRLILNIVEKITYFCASKVYPNSFGLRDIIIKSKFTNENKLKVIGNGSSNGIDTNHFNPSLFSDYEKQSLKRGVCYTLVRKEHPHFESFVDALL